LPSQGPAKTLAILSGEHQAKTGDFRAGHLAVRGDIFYTLTESKNWLA